MDNMATIAYGLRCPKCQSDTRVTDSRPRARGVYRRRMCLSETCGHRFSTHEFIGAASLFEDIDQIRVAVVRLVSALERANA
jgi:transcriptional regulator NrdR family protein